MPPTNTSKTVIRGLKDLKLVSRSVLAYILFLVREGQRTRQKLSTKDIRLIWWCELVCFLLYSLGYVLKVAFGLDKQNKNLGNQLGSLTQKLFANKIKVYCILNDRMDHNKSITN